MTTLRLPGLVDAHVHFREPGYTQKEDLHSGTCAALAGGVTTVLDMPNTVPPTSTPANLQEKVRLAASKAVCDIGLFVGATVADVDAYLPVANGACGLKIYVNETFGSLRIEELGLLHRLFRTWAERADELDGWRQSPPPSSTGRDNSAQVSTSSLGPVAVHAEELMVPVCLALSQLYQVPLHIVHVSRRSEIELIRAAKDKGIPVTCEATPHHLFLTEEDYKRGGSRFDMRPKLAAPDDVAALWENLDIIDIFATDHAPHTFSEKGMHQHEKGHEDGEKNDDVHSSLPGVPGVETLLPLQKEYRMPDADPDSNLQQARDLQTALVSSAPEIILSHARNEEDRPLLASPLLPKPESSAGTNGLERAGAKNKPAHQGPTAGSYAREIFAAGGIESITDTVAPPVAGLHSGGVSLFRDQSQCPFRAFARHRLHSRQLEQADIGLDAMQRGSLLHQLMENTWSQLGSRETLAAMTREEREGLIKSRVTELIADQRKRYPLVFSTRFAAVEGRRLAQVLGDWLELELQRTPFAVVNVEENTRLVIGDVEFTARPDRVDELKDGRRVIIDYKGGEANINAWTGDRPDEPQLPLYAVTHPEPVAAVTFARLKRGKGFGFAGLAESEDVLPDTGAFDQDRRATRFVADRDAQTGAMPPSWEGVFDNWRAVLENLANEFRQGVASVSPKARACDWCDQQPLCRIHEISLK